MRILLLPLDERPCNYIYPQMIASSNHSVHLTMPPLDILPKKKISASFNKIRQYLLKEAGYSRRTSRCSSGIKNT